jgi:predicted small metal-binding protein
MAYRISCVDAGSTCPGSFTTETEDELMKIVDLHQKVAHPEITQSNETWAFVKTLVRSVPGPAPKASV